MSLNVTMSLDLAAILSTLQEDRLETKSRVIKLPCLCQYQKISDVYVIHAGTIPR